MVGSLRLQPVETANPSSSNLLERRMTSRVTANLIPSNGLTTGDVSTTQNRKPAVFVLLCPFESL